MRRLLHRAALAATFLALPSLANAQGQSREVVALSAAFEPARAAAGAHVELRIAAEVRDGWKIYAPDFVGTGVPTKVAVEAEFLEAAGELRFPEPQKIEIPELGEVQRVLSGKFAFTWRQRVKDGTGPGARTAKVRVSFQSCDKQKCLAPDALELDAAIEIGGAAPAAPPAESTALKLPAGDLFGDALGRTAPKATWKLAIDPARLRRGATGAVVAEYEIAAGWHIYTPDHVGDTGLPTRLESGEKAIIREGEASYPAPKTFEIAGEKSRGLDGKGAIRYPFRLAADASPGTLSFEVQVSYMVCSESVCIPTTSPSVKLALEVTDEAPLAAPPAGARGAPAAAGAPAKGGGLGLWAFLLSAVGWGLFTLLMPCTYPMIPLTITYFAKQANVKHTSVLPLALMYGGGIIVCFIVIGVAFGAVIQPFAQHWITNLALAVLFVVFALSFFGLYEIRLPSAFLNLSQRGAQIGGFGGVFLLGLTLVVTSFTCTAPFVGTLLAQGAGAKQSVGTIALGMGVFGLTMAAPFAGLALFPAAVKKMPRSGEWMQTLKVTLGFIEIAAALKFLSNADLVLNWKILPRDLFLLYWAVIAALCGIYLLGLIPLKAEGPARIGPLQMTFAIAFLLLGAYFFNAAMTNRRLNWIMTAIVPNYPEYTDQAAGGGKGRGGGAPAWIKVEDDFDAGLARAVLEKKPALINWTGIT